MIGESFQALIRREILIKEKIIGIIPLAKYLNFTQNTLIHFNEIFL